MEMNDELKNFLKWLKENNYLKDVYDLDILFEQYNYNDNCNWIKKKLNSYFLISSSNIFYDEWERVYKYYFTTNYFKTLNTEMINGKLSKENYKIINVKIEKKSKPYTVTEYGFSTVSYTNARDEYIYELIIGEIDDSDD